MCIIIRRDVLGFPLWRNKAKSNNGIPGKSNTQAGFTLPEVLVSLCIVMLIMHGVWQWGIVMQRTSEAMAQNQQAVFLAQQVFSGIEPQCPDGWTMHVQSEPNGKLLYETKVTIQAQRRQWQFYYAGPEEIVYADMESYAE